MKTITVLLFSLLLAFTSYARSKVDSTISELKQAYENIPVDSIELRTQNLIDQADAYYAVGELISADQLLQEALKNVSGLKNHDLKIAILLKSGWLMREQGRHEEALSQFLSAQSLAEHSQNKPYLAESHQKIGVIYHVMGDFKTARKHYDEALKIYLFLGNQDKIARLYNNYGLIYMDQDRPSSAIPYFERSIEMCDSLGNIRGVAIATENIGLLCYQTLENYSMALNRFEYSLGIWQDKNDLYGQAQTLVYMMYVFNAQEKYQTALDSGYSALSYCLKSGAKDVERDVYKELAIAHEGLNQIPMAYTYYKKHVNLRDSLVSKNDFDQIKLLSLRHDLDEKNLKDSLNLVMLHQQESAEMMLDMETQRFWTGLMSFGLLSFIVIIFLLLKARKQKQKSADLLLTANKMLKTKNNEIIDSINYAKHIQSAILPPTEELSLLLKDYFVYYNPKDIVAGDFYWVVDVPEEDLILFAVADCTGHGVPGAMVSIICSGALNKVVKEMGIYDPGLILTKVTDIVVNTFEKGDQRINNGMDISLISIRKNAGNVDIQFAGANNPLWIIRNDGEIIDEIKGTKRPIGKYESNKPFETVPLTLHSGDTIYMFTDGYADQFGGSENKKFKYKSLKNLFVQFREKKLNTYPDILHETFEEWKGNNEQIDDICVAGIRF